MHPKIVNKEKDAKNEAQHEEHLVTYDPVVKEPSYFKIFQCGKNLLNKLGATCKQACMATSRDKYYTKIYDTLIYYNDRNDVPLSNENFQQAIYKVIEEEELDAHNITLDSHNITVDTFSQTSNTQRENSNAILTSEKLDKSDALAETSKELTINNSGYY